MGYQNITLGSGFSFFTPTFKAVAGGAIDIQNIKCLQTDGSEWKTSGKGATKCAGDVSVQKVDTTGRFGTVYSYYSTLTPVGWYSDNGATYAEGISFADGEGMIVQNTHTVGASFQVSGEVNLNPGIVLANGFSFCGNFTPVTINIQDFACVQIDGSDWKTSGKGATKCAGDVSLQKVDSTGRFGTVYSYYSTLTPAGWYSDNGTVYAEGVTFTAGEGFIVQNTHSVGAKLLPKAPVVQ